MNPKLVRPSATYKKDFFRYKKEIEKESGRMPYSWKSDFETSFSAYIQGCRDNAKGLALEKGWVPSTVFWLVDGKQILGEVSIRHKLTPKLRVFGAHIGYIIRPTKRRRGYGELILKLGLKKAKTIGLTKALITVDEDNIASRKIIERNGGMYLDSVDHEGVKDALRRYWIDLP